MSVLFAIEPTVIADVAEAGDVSHASIAPVLFPFPAATTTTIPAATVLSTAVFNDALNPPPKLMLMTQGEDAVLLVQTLMTWFIAAMIPPVVPYPVAFKTFAEHNLQLLETPYVRPHVVPATCVLWFHSGEKTEE